MDIFLYRYLGHITTIVKFANALFDGADKFVFKNKKNEN